LPHLQKLYAELKDKGLELIAINSGDPEETINKYAKESGFTFKIGMGEKPASDGKNYQVPTLYGVQAYPTNYVLDGEGKVIFRSVGFNEEGLRGALEKLGVK